VRGGVGEDEGSAALELVAVVPGLLLLVLLVLGAGRVSAAQGQVEGAAREAARAASIERTAPSARSAAEAVVLGTLQAEGVACGRLRVTTSGDFEAPAGSPAVASVDVACTIALADLGLPGLGDRTLTTRVAAPIDTFRGRS
jgi:Flp pilus assembly protein TadG